MVWDTFNIYVLVESVWLILPAYAANGLVPVFKRWFRHSIDGKRNFRGNRLFGDGKTWEGFIAGMFFAVLIALVEQFAFPYLPWDVSPVQLNIAPMGVLLGLALGFGTMLGDLMGSFVKRRLGLERGKPTFLIDQEFFVIFALFFAGTIALIKYQTVILLLVITPLVHWAANAAGYLLHVTRRPW
jgi:CDP-2,3-bis-(O-geranylgeranyl)-sn-glycerol synthase